MDEFEAVHSALDAMHAAIEAIHEQVKQGRTAQAIMPMERAVGNLEIAMRELNKVAEGRKTGP